MMRPRYSPIIDKMAISSPLKKDNRTTIDVHPGTGTPIKSFLIIKINPKEKEDIEMIKPNIALSLC